MAAFCSARLASFPRASCRIIAAIDGYIRRACGHAFLTTTTGLSWHRVTSQHTTQAAGSRVAVQPVLHTWLAMRGTPDVALSDDRSRAADGTVER